MNRKVAYELTETHLMSALTEMYEVASLPEADQKFYWLVVKYRAKVSKRLLDMLPPLRIKARESFDKQLKGAMLGMAKLSESFMKNIGPAEPGWAMPLMDYRTFSTKEEKPE